MGKNWELVYSTSKPYEAEMVRSLLESTNIGAVVINKQDSSYMFGDIEVYVHPDQYDQALNIINNTEDE